MWKSLLLCLPLTFLPTTTGESFDCLHLVESVPSGTPMASDDLPSFHSTWLMFANSAQETIDLAHFYASNEKDSKLDTVVVALEQAAERGVKVRFLVDERFYKTYPETLERMAKNSNVQVRRLDLKKHTGGVLHSKYMLTDTDHVCLGSANFDWRALEHIQELGAVVHNAAVGKALGDVFEMDWWLAGGGEAATRPVARVSADDFPVKLRVGYPTDEEDTAWGQAPNVDPADWVKVTPVFSPKELLPSDGLWDLPRLLAWIDGAQHALRIQVMTFRLQDRRGKRFALLEEALLRAAKRGVQVKLLVADWGKRKGTIEGLQALTQVENVEVRMVTIPPAAEGHIPFARVIHSKYMVVDDSKVWLGSSNWEEGYFYESRNAGLLVEGKACADRLTEYFEAGWSGPFGYDVDPAESYTTPRIGD